MGLACRCRVEGLSLALSHGLHSRLLTYLLRLLQFLATEGQQPGGQVGECKELLPWVGGESKIVPVGADRGVVYVWWW